MSLFVQETVHRSKEVKYIGDITMFSMAAVRNEASTQMKLSFGLLISCEGYCGLNICSTMTIERQECIKGISVFSRKGVI